MSLETTNQMRSQVGNYMGGQMDQRRLSCANCQTPLIPKTGEPSITCLHCGQRHNFLDPPTSAETGNFRLGDAVAVKWGEFWWSAHIVEVIQPGLQWKVHFEGWAPIFDDIAGSNRIRALDYVPGSSIVPPPFESEALEVKKNSILLPLLLFSGLLVGIAFTIYLAVNSQITAATQADAPLVREGAVTGPISPRIVSASTPVEYGQRFHVKWGDNWYLGTAIHVNTAGEITIRYDGWGAEYDEIVDRSRLRLIE